MTTQFVKDKDIVLEEAKKAGVATTVLKTGLFSDFVFQFPYVHRLRLERFPLMTAWRNGTHRPTRFRSGETARRHRSPSREYMPGEFMRTLC
jgi:hypothetical protein